MGLRLSLLLACIGSAAIAGLLVFVLALRDADDGLVAALEGKATSHARVIQQDVEIALDLGIPLNEIRGASEYLETGAQEDADIRFAVVTDLDMQRLHYGGMGRRRLDPLLESSALLNAMAAEPDLLVSGTEGVIVEGFSLTVLPIESDEDPVGFIVVGVQDKQVFDELVLDLTGLLPAAIGVLLLLMELALATVGAVFETPLRRLAYLMDRVNRDQPIERSARHDRTEIGTALLRFNGVVHRLATRAQRVLTLADEVERAVFDANIAEEVGRRAESLRTTEAKALLDQPVLKADARSSDVHLSLTLIFAAGLFGAVIASTGTTALFQLWSLAGLALGGALVWVWRSPGWGLILAGVLQIAAAVLLHYLPSMQTTPGLAAAGSTAGIGAALAAGLLFKRRTQALGSVWLLIRLGLGCAAGGLIAWTVIVEYRGDTAPILILISVALAVLAANREPIVRRLLFDRETSTGYR
ncbi:MAG: hypothetical protein AAF414_03285 [Pseudomonadota bacterium]